MRVEGGYTFPAQIEQVYDALTTVAGLEHTLPGCERLIQLGPAGKDGAAAFEARMRLAGDLTTARLTFAAARPPAHARFEVELFSASGHLRARGLFDLVDQGAHTVGAYVLDLKAVEGERGTAPEPERAQAFIQALCDRLGQRLRVDTPAEEEPSFAARATVRTPHGRIVALRAAADAAPLDHWTQRAAWMGAGLLLGMGMLALVTSAARRLADRDAG